MRGYQFLAIVTLTACLVNANTGQVEEEHEFVSLVKDLLQGDELKTFQNAYSSIPVEIRDKLSKNLLKNPGQVGSDLMNMFGPQVQNLMQNLGNFNLGNLASLASNFGNQQRQKQRSRDEENEIDVEVDQMNMNYLKNDNKKRAPGKDSSAGFDFGPLGQMLGNMVSSNPQMLVNMIQSITQATGGKQGFSFDSIYNMLSQQVDLDTVINMAAAFGSGSKDGKSKGFADMLQLQQMMKWWGDFIKSPTGQKVSRVLPRMLKAETLPDALRIIEGEMSFRFDMVLRQIQDPNIRHLMVAQAVRPIGEFFRGVRVPSDLKEVINRADDVLNNKMGFGEKTRSFVEPITQYIREKFRISKESLLDLSPKDIEKIASDILNKEVLDPMSSLWEAYSLAIEHNTCATFIFCQLNNNFYRENFIRRYVIKTSSIVSAFQASANMKKDAFSKLYEAIHHGADGFDCTHGVTGICLELMNTSPHNEL